MIPRTLKIRGHTYKVKQVGRRELGADYLGDVDNALNIIRIYKRAVPSRKVELVLHEVIHAMLCGHVADDDESLVVVMGEAITEFIKANPTFIRHALKTLSR